MKSTKVWSGTYAWKGHLDLFNIVFVGLPKALPEQEEPYELHRLLGALLSKELMVNEKLAIIETEFDIPVVDDIRDDVNIMCNLSQGIREAGRQEAREEARREVQQGMALYLAKQGVPLDVISNATKVSIAVLGQWLEECTTENLSRV